MLFLPLRKFILAMGINRHQKKVQREITAEDLAVLKKRVTVISAVIAITFAFIYNKFIMVKYFGGLGG